MRAISLGTWVDLKDDHEYHEGEAFPHDGRAISEDRINELSTAMNLTGKPMIAILEEKPSKKK